MRTVQDTDAQLNSLLDEVELGETVVITRLGRPVARLVPERRERAAHEDVIEAIRAFRETMPRLSLDEIRSSFHEGHCY